MVFWDDQVQVKVQWQLEGQVRFRGCSLLTSSDTLDVPIPSPPAMRALRPECDGEPGPDSWRLMPRAGWEYRLHIVRRWTMQVSS